MAMSGSVEAAIRGTELMIGNMFASDAQIDAQPRTSKRNRKSRNDLLSPKSSNKRSLLPSRNRNHNQSLNSTLSQVSPRPNRRFRCLN